MCECDNVFRTNGMCDNVFRPLDFTEQTRTLQNHDERRDAQSESGWQAPVPKTSNAKYRDSLANISDGPDLC
jgi:hypothetical protein